jgi:hypothetical protein
MKLKKNQKRMWLSRDSVSIKLWEREPDKDGGFYYGKNNKNSCGGFIHSPISNFRSDRCIPVIVTTGEYFKIEKVKK